MKDKSEGLEDRLGCKKVHREKGDCLAGPRILILCRHPVKFQTSKEFRTSTHRLYEGVAKENAYAKIEVPYMYAGK